MLSIRVRLIHGTFRGSASDLAMTGQDDPGEWPPSPARIVAALVAAGGIDSASRVSDGAELRLFETAAPPSIQASPPEDVLTSPLRPRFVVMNERRDATVQEYPARTAAEARPGSRRAPRDPTVIYTWSDISPSIEELDSLKTRAARVGYLGCADSPAVMTVLTELEPIGPGERWAPVSDGDQLIAVPGPGYVDMLSDYYLAWTTGTARRAWYPVTRAAYAVPGQHVARWTTRWPHVLWMRLADPLPGELVIPVTETFRSSVLALYQRYIGDPPQLLHGHGYDGRRDYQHAQYIALPDVGHEYATGRIHGLAVMLPSDASAETVESLRTALWRPWSLRIPGRAPVAVRPYGGENRPLATQPRRWSRPAQTWMSVFPVVHERRRRHGPSPADVVAWCRHAGFPDPVSATLSLVPLINGSPALRPEHVFRDRDDSRRPYSFLAVSFGSAVTGPMVLGRLRQFGLGLMLPVATGAVDDR